MKDLAKSELATEVGTDPDRTAAEMAVTVPGLPRVAIVGQPGWGRHVAGMLLRHAADLVAPTMYTGSGVRRLLYGRQQVDVLFRIGYRPGAPTARGRGFDAFWAMVTRRHPEARPVYYWLGTDVLNAVADARRGALRRPFFGSVSDIHLATAPWHVEELAALGLKVAFAPLPVVLPTEPVSPMPPDFGLLTYVAANRFSFYGGPQLVDLARRFPDVPIRVMGNVPHLTAAPPNLQNLGWVTDTAERYLQSSVVLRLVEHDGIGATVLEALAHARHVIYTYPFPHVRHVTFGDQVQLAQQVGELLAAHRDHLLPPNREGRAYVLKAHDPRRLSRFIAAALGSAAGREGSRGRT